MHQIQLLKKYELSVRGIRGQHLLIDENIQRKFVETLNAKQTDTILEIGPGLGAITELLLASGARVIAIEQDPRFVEILKGELASDYKNFTLVHSDILKVNLSKFASAKEKLKIAGNIPYYITSAILLYLISYRKIIDSVYLTVQREIADRIFAQPATKTYGRLSLLVRYYCDVRRLFEISRNCFSPKPKVDSTAIELVFRQKLSAQQHGGSAASYGGPAEVDETLLFNLIKHGFGKRRKNILNAFAEGFGLPKDKLKILLNEAGIPEKTRAEELMLKDFIQLAKLFSNR